MMSLVILIKRILIKKNGVFGTLREPVFFLRWLNFFSLTKNILANFWIWIRFFELAKYSISKWFDLLILEYAAFKKIMKIYVPYMVHRHKFRWMKAKWSPIKRAIFDDTIIQSLSAHFQLSLFLPWYSYHVCHPAVDFNSYILLSKWKQNMMHFIRHT